MTFPRVLCHAQPNNPNTPNSPHDIERRSNHYKNMMYQSFAMYKDHSPWSQPSSVYAIAHGNTLFHVRAKVANNTLKHTLQQVSGVEIECYEMYDSIPVFSYEKEAQKFVDMLEDDGMTFPDTHVCEIDSTQLVTAVQEVGATILLITNLYLVLSALTFVEFLRTHPQHIEI